MIHAADVRDESRRSEKTLAAVHEAARYRQALLAVAAECERRRWGRVRRIRKIVQAALA